MWNRFVCAYFTTNPPPPPILNKFPSFIEVEKCTTFVQGDLTECPHKRQKHTQGPYHGFSWNLGGLIHLWVWLTTPNIFGLGSPLWAGQTPLGPILLVKSKNYLTALTTPKWKISYILVKTLMGNFEFQRGPVIFWRGH